MKLAISVFFSSIYLFCPSSFAKFAGIPTRIEQPKEEKEAEKEPEEKELSPSLAKETCPPPITTSVIKALLGAERINEPLHAREEDRLNELVDFFRQMAAQRESQASDLMALIKRSHLQAIARINLAAAVILGKADSQQTITYDEVDVLKQIAKKSDKLTDSTYRSFDRSFRVLMQNASRSMRDDLRDIRRDFDTFRSPRK